MTTEEVAKKLVELCNQGAYEEAIKTLYDKDVVSVEPRGYGRYAGGGKRIRCGLR